MLKHKLRELKVQYDKWKPRVDKIVLYSTFALIMDYGIGNWVGDKSLHQYVYTFPKQVENSAIPFTFYSGLAYTMLVVNPSEIDTKKRRKRQDPKQLSFDF